MTARRIAISVGILRDMPCDRSRRDGAWRALLAHGRGEAVAARTADGALREAHRGRNPRRGAAPPPNTARRHARPSSSTAAAERPPPLPTTRQRATARARRTSPPPSARPTLALSARPCRITAAEIAPPPHFYMSPAIPTPTSGRYRWFDSDADDDAEKGDDASPPPFGDNGTASTRRCRSCCGARARAASSSSNASASSGRSTTTAR